MRSSLRDLMELMNGDISVLARCQANGNAREWLLSRKLIVATLQGLSRKFKALFDQADRKRSSCWCLCGETIRERREH